MNVTAVEKVVHEALGRVFPAAQLEVRLRGEPVLSRAYGWLDPDTRTRPTTPDTLFDLASLTKLYTVTAAMSLFEQGAFLLDDPVRTALPEFAGPRPICPDGEPHGPGGGPTADAGLVTFRQLLSHSAGLPAWRPLYREAGPAEALRAALATSFAYSPGERVIYSDLGPILLGMALERLAGQPLAGVVARRVTGPAGLGHTRYLPDGSPPAASEESVAPTELCAWRGRRLLGEVHDENAARLGGVAGHAGLFATAADVAAFGQTFLEVGGSLLRPGTVARMVRPQAEEGAVPRGLGFALWSPDPEAAAHPLGRHAFGHTGYTGTSLWVDPERALVIACLTNRVYYGREPSGILRFRVTLHRAIVEAVDGGR